MLPNIFNPRNKLGALKGKIGDGNKDHNPSVSCFLSALQ